MRDLNGVCDYADCGKPGVIIVPDERCIDIRTCEDHLAVSIYILQPDQAEVFVRSNLEQLSALGLSGEQLAVLRSGGFLDA